MEETGVAQQTSVILFDDIDGSKAAETVAFGLDGADYEIDLSKRNAAALRKALTEFVAHGRRSPKVSPLNKRVQRRSRKAGASPAVIRVWAAQQGIAVSQRGRIPAGIVAQYEASQQG
jgi:hypothetical protein